MKRYLLILPIVLFLLSFGVTAPVYAQLTEPLDGCQTFDFTISDGGWASRKHPITNGNLAIWNNGVGWVGQSINFASDSHQKNASLQLTFGALNVTSVTMIGSVTLGSGGGGIPGHFIRVISESDLLDSEVTTSPPPSGSVEVEYTHAGIEPVTVVQVGLWGHAYVGAGSAGSATITSIEICGESIVGDGEIGRPFKSSDEDEWGLYQHGEHEAVVAFSGNRGDFVHAGFSGTVTLVDNTLGINRCADALEDDISSGCDLRLPDEVTGFGIVSFYKIGNRLFNNFLEQSVPGAGRIVIQSSADPDLSLTYFVLNPGDYVDEGATITEGCVIGKAMTFIGVATTELVSIGQPNDRGVVVMQYHDEGEPDAIPLIDEFKSTFPTSDTPCNTPPDYQDCYGGSTLDHPENWNASDGASIDSPGATLGRFSNITYTSPFNLNELRNPRMRVNARATGGAAQMVLTLGSTSDTFEVSTGSYNDYLLSGANIEGDIAGGLYTIRIANNSDASISIRYICISHELEEDGGPVPEPPPPVCYFQNPSFVNGLEHWTADAGVSVGNSPGEIHVPDDDSFYQSVHLFAGDYTIRLRAGIRYYVAYSPDETEDTDNLEFDYVYDALDESMGVATFGELAAANNSYEFITTFNLASETTANFIFTPTLTTSDGSVVGAAVRDVCLYAGDDPDAPFPGYDPPTEPQPGPFVETCDPFSEPQGSAVHHWLAWHWYKLNQFFQCDLMVLLNQMYQAITRFFTMMGYVMRWMMLNIQLSINWIADQVLPWLGGYLANAGGGVIVADQNTSPGSGCAPWDLLCHLRNVFEDIVGGIGDAIFDVANWLWEGISTAINAIISFIGDLFNAALSVLNTIVNFLGQIIERLVEFAGAVISAVVSFAIDVIEFVFMTVVKLAEAVVSAIISVITQIIEMLMFIRDIIVTLIQAWNTATPEPIAVLTCEGNEITESVCWIWWVVNNTILAGTLGKLIVPLLTAIAFIIFAIRFVTDIRHAFLETAANSA